MLAYPEGLPTPQREGYGFDPVSPMTSTKLVTGRSERRRAFVSTPTVATVTWLLTAPEARLFEGWFEYVLLSGSLPFECPLLTPMGMEPYRANFVDIYSGPVLVGVDFWRFSAQLSYTTSTNKTNTSTDSTTASTTSTTTSTICTTSTTIMV